MTIPARHVANAKAKEAVRAALAVVGSVTTRNVASMANVSVWSLYAYADTGTSTRTGKPRKSLRPTPPTPETMRRIAAAQRTLALSLMTAADELEAASHEVEDADAVAS